MLLFFQSLIRLGQNIFNMTERESRIGHFLIKLKVETEFFSLR